MEGYVGKDITAVAVKYGAPHASFQMPDGRQAFQWRTSNTYVTPMNTTVTAYGNTAYAQTTGGQAFSSNCVYTLYGKPNKQNSFTIVGFEKPTLDCE
jgi:hypothetical protein